ncbi:MarR family transcriptional regulator [Alphaproteobacteria bacterium]|nr:MarR family transcriptional regulator [Alphaproteobacteria bacterium]MDG2467476.1 MarR family transcriptional regulator [Alphaproteobacteria bacterium]
MTDLKTPHHPLFLREEELRYSIELMFFAYRDFTAEADTMLASCDLGRAHHRVIYFVGRNPGINVSDLLAILNITKQSLSRVLSHLITDDYIHQEQGTTDKRQRLLSLTDKGKTLEHDVTMIQRRRFAQAFKSVSTNDVTGFISVMEAMLDDKTLPLLRRTPMTRMK